MTELLFRADPYLREAEARVIGHTPEGGILIGPLGLLPDRRRPARRQRADLDWDDGRAGHRHGGEGRGRASRWFRPSRCRCRRWVPLLAQVLDWDRRHRHMRVHTALHLLSVVIPLPVTGGQIGAERGRLDFDMPDPPGDVAALDEALNAPDRPRPAGDRGLDHRRRTGCPARTGQDDVRCPADRAGPGAAGADRAAARIRSTCNPAAAPMSPAPPRSVGSSIGRIEKKGRQNRRVSITLED